MWFKATDVHETCYRLFGCLCCVSTSGCSSPSLSPNGRHTSLIAALTLGFGDALPLPLQHGFPLGLSHGTDDGQHQPAGCGSGIQRLAAGHGPERDLPAFEPGDPPPAQRQPSHFIRSDLAGATLPPQVTV